MIVQTRRVVPSTFLFCPADRPERVDKALAAAPAIILDLEDAVAPTRKAVAREQALARLAAVPDGESRFALRINDICSSEGLEDLHALLHCESLPADLTIVVPKVACGRDLQWLRMQLARRFPQFSYVALLESLEGLAKVGDIVSVGRPDAMGFGAADLATQLNVANRWEPLLFARSQLVAAAASLGVPALDVPEVDVTNEAALREGCARAKEIGFFGKFAIHPRQVAPILQCFAPTAEELENADRIRNAFEAVAGSACIVDGRMVDLPIYNAALRVLARAVH